MAVIALDVGGSSVKHGIVDLTNPAAVIVQTTPINSRGTADAIINTFASIIRGYGRDNPDVTQVGFGFPGPFDYDVGVSSIKGLEKYESIYGLNVRDLLLVALKNPDLDMRFRNDAEAAIVGEAIFGIGASYNRIIGVTLGTGFGSAFIAGGQVIREGAGVPANGWLYPALFRGSRADDLFSTRGLLDRLQSAGISVPSLENLDQSSPVVQKVYSSFGSDLGTFLQPFAQAFGADCVLVLGGISGAYPLFADALNKYVRARKGVLDERAALLGIAHHFFS